MKKYLVVKFHTIVGDQIMPIEYEEYATVLCESEILFETDDQNEMFEKYHEIIEKSNNN